MQRPCQIGNTHVHSFWWHGAQGAHGLWELSVNKMYHADMVEDLLEALVAQLACPDLQVSPTHHMLQPP